MHATLISGRRWLHTVGLALVVQAPIVAHGEIKVGAMGDSITDEWSNLDPTGAQNTLGYATAGVRNWVEFADQTGKLDFGTYRPFTLVSGNLEVRRAGPDKSSYTWNFARQGASTEANGLGAFNTYFSKSYTQNPPVPAGAPTNFLTMAQAGTVDYGVLILGGNDFLAGISTFTYFKDVPPTDPANATRLDNMIASVRTGLLTATNNGTAPIKMVLGDLFDVGAALTSAGASFTPQQRTNIRDNVIAWNSRIDNLAATIFSTPVPVVSLFKWWEDAAAGNTIVHGIPIQARAAPTTAIRPDKTVDFTGWNNLVLPDGVHPAPIGAALLADRVIDAIRSGYGEMGVTPYTSKELVTLTGLDPQKPPMAMAGSAYNLSTGHALTLSAAGSTDPNPGDIPYLQYSWDINGVADAAVGANPTLSWAQLTALGIGVTGTYHVDVRVDDTFGGVTTSAPVDLQVTPLPGDANFDGIVNGQDISQVAGNWLAAGSNIPGDANGDGIVNGQDIALIAANWLSGAGGGSAATVAEPSCLMLSVVGSLAVLMDRRRLPPRRRQ